jgi:hypothetical protein
VKLFFVKSFALLTMKSSASPQVKSDADASGEIKSTHARRHFTARRAISHCEAIFLPPVRVDLVEKSKSFDLLFSLPTEGGL